MKGLKTITQQELNEVLAKHRKWLDNEKGGEKANLSYTDLSFLNFRNCDLRHIDLSYSDLLNAHLSNSYLAYADLRYAHLSNSYLAYADLRYADLSNANLSFADLSHANLRKVVFSNCNLKSCDLRFADLSNANLSHANLEKTLTPIYCPHFVTHTHDFKEITIGCKRKTIEEWDYFFNESDKEYETKRGTEEFKRIQANYLAMKAYIEFMKK